MVFILDGWSFYYADIWSKKGISICWRHLVTSKESSNPIFFLGKWPCLHHTCATWNEQPSNIKTMIWCVSMSQWWNICNEVLRRCHEHKCRYCSTFFFSDAFLICAWKCFMIISNVCIQYWPLLYLIRILYVNHFCSVTV